MEPNFKQGVGNLHQGDSLPSHDISRAQTLDALLRGVTVDVESVQALVRPLAEPYALVAMHPSCPVSHSGSRTRDDVHRGPSSRIAMVNDGDYDIALISNADARRFAEEALEKDKGPKLVGLSFSFSSTNAISQQYKLLKYSLNAHGGEGLVEVKDYVLYYLRDEILENVDTRGLLHPALAKLARYDEANQSSLLETLKVYLMYDRNAQRCANTLYLHRNSLQYRVRRIQEIAGIDLENPDDRAYLRLSFFLSGM